MDHQLRDNYLGAMGIATWYPRYLMPNAPEPDFDYGQVDELDALSSEKLATSDRLLGTTSSSAVIDVASPSVALGKLKGLMDPGTVASNEVLNVDSQHKDAKEPEEKPFVASMASDALSKVIVPPFGFVFFRYELGVAVLIEIDAAYTLSSMETSFVANVLASVDISSDFVFSHRVDWPLVKGNPRFQTQRSFVDSMHAVLLKQVSEVGVHSLILLGDHLREYLVPVISESLSSETNVITAPHIQTLMFSAESKQALWRDIAVITSGAESDA